ncbi:MAG: hypothetical protein M3Q54_05940, partial [Actinomycetota bacterium]|nr:hypothetical protein [Actinomycetota bacterium]
AMTPFAAYLRGFETLRPGARERVIVLFAAYLRGFEVASMLAREICVLDPLSGGLIFQSVRPMR